MRALLQSMAVLVVLPYALLAALFLLIGEAARTHGLLELIDVALAHANWILQWGMYVFAFLYLILLVVAFVPRLRRGGALCLSFVAAGSLLVICTLHSTAIDFGQFLFLLPCFAAAILGAWLFARDGRAPQLEQAA
jgi:hypothetical protein